MYRWEEMRMHVSEKCIQMLKHYEGYRSQAYICPAGVWTIGYGTTKGVKKGCKITMALADSLLRQDVKTFEDNLNRVIRTDVKLTQEMFDSLVSLSYNIGIGAFNGSTCLKRLNEGDFTGAFEAFQWWNKITVNGVKQISGGLKNRRTKEVLHAGFKPIY